MVCYEESGRPRKGNWRTGLAILERRCQNSREVVQAEMMMT